MADAGEGAQITESALQMQKPPISAMIALKRRSSRAADAADLKKFEWNETTTARHKNIENSSSTRQGIEEMFTGRGKMKSGEMSMTPSRMGAHLRTEESI